MKRRAFTLVEALVIVAVVMILVAVLLPAHHGSSRLMARRFYCQSNLKQIVLASRQYNQDSDERFPVVSGAATFGWADALRPYLKDTNIYQCPSEESNSTNGADPMTSGYTDYWFNRRLAGINGKQLKAADQTILLGDGNSGLDVADARYSKYRLPPRWIQDTKSPAYRHLDGANYGFADSHVKWLKPTQVTSFPIVRRMPTFAVR